MGHLNVLSVCTLYWVFSLLCSRAKCCNSEDSVKFLKAPHAFSHLNSATFLFEVLEAGNGTKFTSTVSCKLDDGMASDCEAGKVFYKGLQDGDHTFSVCINRPQGVGCASYNWTIDTVPPTAHVTASTSFTNALNVSVNISFSEPCMGGGFGCLSVNACNLLVYGAGEVIPSSLSILQTNLVYSLVVSLSSTLQYGRAILVMDKNFCTDSAGNRFMRTANSTFFVHFDRRRVYGNMTTHIPERLLHLNSDTRVVQATNNYNNLKVYLYFSEPVLNSSAEIMSSLNITQGSLVPSTEESLGNRRFGFWISDVSSIAIITVGLNANSIISRQGSPISPIEPVTFLYDSERPAVKLSTYSMRTREHNLQILIKFMKPVFGFNSSYISISGGHLKSFQGINRSIYTVEIQADETILSVIVPENVTGDIAGNKNLASNVLQVRHYSVPLISSVISALTTASFLLTSLAGGLLTVSTASLQSVGAFIKSTSSLTNDPARNLFRIICHIQIFALSRWLAVTLPVEYYEFARELSWSTPYFTLPWENTQTHATIVGSSPFGSSYSNSAAFQSMQLEEENVKVASPVHRLPLTPTEYKLNFENQNLKTEAEYILESQDLSGWRKFSRIMFWLAVISGSLILLHSFPLLILKLKRKNCEKQSGYGALTFPRFEIFLLVLAVPSISEASTALVKGGASSVVVAGIALLVVVSILLLALFLFLSVGITFGKLLQYKEVHHEDLKCHWYQDVVRVTLGPGKRGQWTWKNQSNPVYLAIFGPLFEDLRGPPKYMLSQISGGNPQNYGDRIIATDDETEDAEAPFIQKLFGILRIYYTLLESIRRVLLGSLAGTYKENRSSQTPTTMMLCISSFQLFFLVLKKPFIKKKVQLVEIISVSCEVGFFTTCLVLSKKFSVRDETKVGIFMIVLFLVGYFAQMINEWYALYRQTRLLDPAKNSFSKGLKIASVGFLIYFIPQKFIKNLESYFPGNRETVDPTSSADRYRRSSSRSSGSSDKTWLEQLREKAKASFSREGNGAPKDPSSSHTRWSGFWRTKRSGSSSLNSSSDFKAKDSKPTGLYKDLEAIFSSK
ncbi:Guanine nucleotide-binding protein, beta subunit [Quillaja saponaria]|uniref:Guanine nucleotide-binding protein, beta subunit n=1 Tax=Quillaja saponaria TaxID=32244 RepID=A0AAD7PIR6_QUISA|nr:Guanine nucleotide-binding protein, beta subunit [Quillaja saponaria]